MKQNKKSKIIQYRKGSWLNIGTLMFSVLFLYMVICIIMYMMSSHIAPYEVSKGNLSGNYKYTALVLKSEFVVEAPESGNLTYYVREGTQMGANDVVCSIHEGAFQEEDSAVDSTQEKSENTSLSPADAKKLRSVIASSVRGFSGSNFQQAYELKTDIESAILDISAESSYKESTLTDTGIMNLCRTSQEGLIAYTVDGYEQVQPEDVTLDMFDTKAYHRENLRLQTSVGSGDPLYKLIMQDTWSLMVPIDGKLAAELTDQSVIKIRFLKDGVSQSAKVNVLSNDGVYFAQLNLDASVVRYINDRFLDIELLLNKKSGLKIPKSAIAEKMFYVIPEEYVIYDENNPHDICLVREAYDNDGTAQVKQITATVYEKKEDKYYVDINLFSEGDYIIKKNSNNKYRIEETATLKGVYNINKGYAVFREITVLADNEEYCIVEEGTTFGLAQYDHIALDSDTVTDDQILY